MAAKFEIYEDKGGEFRFRLKAGNGEIVAVGESYPTEEGARRGCEAVKRAAAEAEVPGAGALGDGDNTVTNMRGRDTPTG